MDAERTACLRFLTDCYELDRLAVAGPPIPFDPEASLSAAWFVARAGWYLICADEPAQTWQDTLAIQTKHRTWTADLSADLTLRFAATLHRRAFARAADDPLTRVLERELSRWPLSGVLADLSTEPAGDLNFGGHPGLQLLYAERLAANPKPHWMPKEGRTLEVVEWVTQGTRTNRAVTVSE